MIPLVFCANTEEKNGTTGVSGESNERETMANQMDARWKIRILRYLTMDKWKLNRCLRVNHSPISGALRLAWSQARPKTTLLAFSASH